MEENEARQNEKIGGASGAEPFLDHGYGFCLTLAHVQHTARLRAPPLISSDPARLFPTKAGLVATPLVEHHRRRVLVLHLRAQHSTRQRWKTRETA